MPPFTKTKLAKAIADGQLHFRQSLTLAAGAIASTQALAVDNNISAVNGYTTVSSNGNTHTVTNDFVKNGTPVNVFNDFVVGDAHTVNLIVPTDADKLVSLGTGLSISGGPYVSFDFTAAESHKKINPDQSDWVVYGRLTCQCW